MKQLIICIFTLGLLNIACQSDVAKTEDSTTTEEAAASTTNTGDETATTPASETTTSTEADNYLIETRQFFGIALGRNVADYPNKLEKGTLKNGEGEFEVHYIKDAKGEQLGYANTTPLDKTKISSITILSDKGHTKEGARVGMDFQKLDAVLGGVQVFGSEIEGRTFAVKENLQFMLDAAHFTYNIDKSEIAADTKVKAITINSIMIY